MTKLSELYDRRSEALHRAKDRLGLILKEVETEIEDKTLVRAEVRSIRIKQLPELARKAEKNGWGANDAMSLCGDLVGGRVVCNNIEDVYRFAELLKEKLPQDGGSFQIQDQIKEPNDGGYRAVHVNFGLDTGGSMALDLIPCEVQIRSRLQDSWAELSHDDIYKQKDLPEDLRRRVRDLADILAVADTIASDIRKRAVQEATPPAIRPDLSRVSAEGLAFVFKEVFGRGPPNYALRWSLNMCGTLKINSLEFLPKVLARSEFRDRLANTYRSILGAEISAESLFLGALHAVAQDDDQALKYVRRQARNELREMNKIYEREILGLLPDTAEELLAKIMAPEHETGVIDLAVALGTVKKCTVCGTQIIDPFAFAESVVQHYDLPDSEADIAQRIDTAVRQCGVETGGWNNSSLCAYHDAAASKDN